MCPSLLRRSLNLKHEGHLMKSWKAMRFGTPEEALTIQELEIPAPGDGQVAIKVRAASVSLPDLLMREFRLHSGQESPERSLFPSRRDSFRALLAVKGARRRA